MTKSMYDVCLKSLQMLHMVLLRGFTYLVNRGGGSRGAGGPAGPGGAWLPDFFRNRKENRAEREVYYCWPPSGFVDLPPSLVQISIA